MCNTYNKCGKVFTINSISRSRSRKTNEVDILRRLFLIVNYILFTEVTLLLIMFRIEVTKSRVKKKK